MNKTFIGFFEVDNIEDIKDKNAIFLFGIPFERTKATKGGSKRGPIALRKQSNEFSGISTDFDINDQKSNFYDLGDFHPLKDKEEIHKIWELAVKTNSRLLVLGGDHSITYDTLINAPWNDDTALIWIDAHADLANEYPSGIYKSHGTVFSNLKSELGLTKNQMLFIGGHAYTLTTTENQKIKNNKTTNYISTQEFLSNREEGLREVEKFVSNFKTIYLSIDADAMDQAYVPTVSTMEPFGFTPTILIDILNIILPKAIYTDFVEINFTRKSKLALNFGVGLIYRILEIWSRYS